jgi:hypothetical protein
MQAKCAFFGPSLPTARRLSPQTPRQRRSAGPRAAGKEVTVRAQRQPLP